MLAAVVAFLALFSAQDTVHASFCPMGVALIGLPEQGPERFDDAGGADGNDDQDGKPAVLTAAAVHGRRPVRGRDNLYS